MPPYSCRICKSSNLRQAVVAREMMFGSRELFDYHQCGECLSLQISSLPTETELSKFYPKDYYSFQSKNGGAMRRIGKGLMNWASREVSRHNVGWPTFCGKALRPLSKRTDVTLHQMLKVAELKPSDSVLDVGSGAHGNFLNHLKHIGLHDLTGCDPFIASDLVTESGISIKKASLDKIEGSFDLIAFNHSLEHSLDPTKELKSARIRLKRDGRCLVRIPTPSCELWDIFGVNWVEFDAPRHLHLISRDGMRRIGEDSGLSLLGVIDDETFSAQRASDFYKKDVPLFEQSAASEAEIDDLTTRANARNRLGRGCRAGFIFKRKD